MFGANPEKLAKGKHWSKLAKLAEKPDESIRVEVAKACGLSKDDEPYNLLITLTKDPSPAVQMAAIKSLGEVGRPAASTHLQWLAEHIPADRTEEQKLIHEALGKIRTRK